MKFKSSKIPILVSVVLASCLLVPDFTADILVSELSFHFLNNISETGLYLMLFVFSLGWSCLSWFYGNNVFSFKKLLKLIFCIPTSILVCVLTSGFLLVVLRRWSESIGRIIIAPYKILDLIVLSFFIYLVYKTLKKLISSDIKPQFSIVNFFSSVSVALFFLLILISDINICNTIECRANNLKNALGEEVYQVVEKYIQTSPVIQSDIGQVKTIANQSGKKVRVTVWLDYDANMNLEVLGEKGVGFLQLMIAGNNYKSIEIFDGTWSFNGQSIPIGSDGKADYSKIKYDLLQEREKTFQNLIDADDCQNLLELIETNLREEKEQKAYQLDYQKVSIAKAHCFEKLGQTEKAAEQYAQSSFFSRPTAFQEKPEDIKKIELAREYLLKAMKLNADYKYIESWQTSLEGLVIQEELTKKPCDDELRNKLRENLAKNRVHYTNLPACIPIVSK